MSYTLHLGDALEVMPTLPAASVNAIITDLPYGVTNCSWDAVIPFAPMWEQVKRMLKPGGVFVTTASQPFTSALVMSNLDWFRYEWVWDKHFAASFALCNIRPMIVHENVLVFSAGAQTYNPMMTKRSVPIKLGGKRESITAPLASKWPHEKTYTDKYPVSILDISNRSEDRGLHPTQKPVALYAYLIRTYTNPGDIVLDPCAGSGTTGVAAIKEGRGFVGIERDVAYHAIATRRIEDAAAQPMLFEVTP